MNVVSHRVYSKVVTILWIIRVKLFIHTSRVKLSLNKKKYAKILPNSSPKNKLELLKTKLRESWTYQIEKYTFVLYTEYPSHCFFAVTFVCIIHRIADISIFSNSEYLFKSLLVWLINKFGFFYCSIMNKHFLVFE